MTIIKGMLQTESPDIECYKMTITWRTRTPDQLESKTLIPCRRNFWSLNWPRTTGNLPSKTISLKWDASWRWPLRPDCVHGAVKRRGISRRPVILTCVSRICRNEITKSVFLSWWGRSDSCYLLKPGRKLFSLILFRDFNWTEVVRGYHLEPVAVDRSFCSHENHSTWYP